MAIYPGGKRIGSTFDKFERANTVITNEGGITFKTKSGVAYDPAGGFEGTDLGKRFAAEMEEAGGVWDWFKARVKAADYQGIHVNDYVKMATQNGYEFTMRIAGIDIYRGIGETTRVGHHIDFISDELWPESISFNFADTNNGYAAQPSVWLASNANCFVNSVAGDVVAADTGLTHVDYTTGGVYYYLPPDVKRAISPKYIFSPQRYDDSGLKPSNTAISFISMGDLWLPSDIEIFNITTILSVLNMGAYKQYPEFAAYRTKKVAGRNTYASWFACSPASTSTEIVSVHTTGRWWNKRASEKAHVPICFRIGGELV